MTDEQNYETERSTYRERWCLGVSGRYIKCSIDSTTNKYGRS